MTINQNFLPDQIRMDNLRRLVRLVSQLESSPDINTPNPTWMVEDVLHLGGQRPVPQNWLSLFTYSEAEVLEWSAQKGSETLADLHPSTQAFSDRLTKLFSEAAEEAVQEHHAAGHPVWGEVDGEWKEIPPPNKEEIEKSEE